MVAFHIKQGATFELRMQAREADGAVSDLTGMAIDLQLRDAANALVDEPAVTNGGASGLITVLASAAATAAWPIGVLRADIRIAAGATVVISETFNVHVQKAVTH